MTRHARRTDSTQAAIVDGGVGKRRSPKFNFSVKSQPLDRWRVIVAKIKNRGAGL